MPAVGVRASLHWCPSVISMLDCGAPVNLLSAAYFASMKNKAALIPQSSHELLSINGSQLNVSGVVHVYVRVAGVFIKPRVRFFVVENLPADLKVLFGLEFFMQHLHEINWTQQTFALRARPRLSHRLIVYAPGTPGVCRVHLTRTESLSAAPLSVPVSLTCAVTVRKHRSCFVNASVAHESLGPTQNGQHWLFEPRPQTELAGAAGLCASVSPADGVIPVYLENTTQRTVRLVAGYRIGSLSIASTVEPSTTQLKDKMQVHPARIGQITAATVSTMTKVLKLNDNVSIDLSNSIDMTPEQKSRLETVLRKNIAVFAENPKRTPTTQLAQHRIDTGSALPVAAAPYRVSPAQLAVIDTQVQDMLENGIIRPSSSPYSSPVLLVKKADGTDRFCVDFRKLNAITKKDVYPLPRVDDMLDALGKADYFTVLDLQSGFWQIPLHPEDREKTAFSTARGHYEFNVMPFGLCNAPATFQRAMDHLLRTLRRFCLPYMDDVIIFSQGDFDRHLQHIDIVLQKLQSAPMVAKPIKFKVMQKELKFLGHIIAPHTIRPDPQKTSAVLAFPTPRSVRDLQSFLGLVSYYRRFVPSMATLAEPLYRLFKKNAPWRWDRVEAAAMESLKIALTSPPLMSLPDFDRDFFLCTDASDCGIGAVLSQLDKDSKEHPVYYASRTLNPAERNYSTSERECLAVKWACDLFRPYLLGRPFKLYTDHAALRWLFRTKDPKSKLVRWILALQEYNMTILPRPGQSNANADALSRLPGLLLQPSVARSHQLIAVVTRGATHSLPTSRRRDGVDPDFALDARAYDTVEAVRQSLQQGRPRGRGPVLSVNKEAENADPTDKEAAPSVEFADPTDKGVRELADPTNTETTGHSRLLQENSTEIEHQHGLMDEEPADAIDDSVIDAADDVDHVPVVPQTPLSSTMSATLPKAQRADQRWLSIILCLEDENTLDPLVTDSVREESRAYLLFDGVLYQQWDKAKVRPRLSTRQYRVVIPASLRGAVLREFHDGVCGAHLGENKTYERIADSMFWPGMYKDILDYVHSCAKCSARKTHLLLKQTPLRWLPYPSEPFEALGIDVLGPLPTTKKKNKFILVATDYHTRWPIALAMKDQKAPTIATLLVEQVFCQHGFPATLLSDRGTNFLSQLIAAVLKVFHVKKLNTTSYHPQTNGLTERFNHTLCTMLTPYVNQNQDDWDEYLPYVLLAYRTTPHHTLKQTPFYLLYGRNVRFPFDSLIDHRPLDDMEMSLGTADYANRLIQKLKVARQTVDAQLRNISHQRETSNAAITDALTFAVGDRVLLHNPVVKPGRSRKLTSPWTGPFRVIDSYPNLVNYKVHPLDKNGRLSDNARSRLVHVSRLKRYVDPSTSDIRQGERDSPI